MSEFLWCESDIISGTLVRDAAGQQAGRIIRGAMECDTSLYSADGSEDALEACMIYSLGDFTLLRGVCTPAELVTWLNEHKYTRA